MALGYFREGHSSRGSCDPVDGNRRESDLKTFSSAPSRVFTWTIYSDVDWKRTISER